MELITKRNMKVKQCLIYSKFLQTYPRNFQNLLLELLELALIVQVAVLTVDPTSAMTGGSLLGDLTRMQNLSINPRYSNFLKLILMIF